MRLLKILIASASAKTLEKLEKLIPIEEDYIHVTSITSLNTLIRRMATENFDLVIIAISKKADENFLETASKRFTLQSIICADFTKSYELAVKAIKLGISFFFTMPDEIALFSEVLKNKINEWKTKSEIEKLLNIRKEQFDFSAFIGNSDKIKKVMELVKKAVEHKDLTILIIGETGTGKNLLARIIHQNTYSDVRPFVEINCASIPATLLESELFGHEKGAFTDAKDRKIGLFEIANGGTIFLNEIDDLNLNLQGKILRVIEDKTFRRIGGIEILHFEGRIIASTNRNLETLVKENKFRKDLYYRLTLLPIQLPPLRERGDDVIILAEHFINKFNQLYRRNSPQIMGLTPEAKRLLKEYPWPGNVRELKHAIERAVILTNNEYLCPEDFKFLIESKIQSHTFSVEEKDQNIHIKIPIENASIENLQKELVKSVLDYVSWNKTRASQILKISRPRLDRLIQKYRLTSK